MSVELNLLIESVEEEGSTARVDSLMAVQSSHQQKNWKMELVLNEFGKTICW